MKKKSTALLSLNGQQSKNPIFDYKGENKDDK